MKIDLTCPAELWRYELPRSDYPACDLMMYNLSERIIVSVEVTLILSDKAGDELERLIYRAHDLLGEPARPFTFAVPLEDAEDAREVELIIEKVWFDDNSVWRRGKNGLAEYTPNTLPNSRSLEMLRFVAGSNAVGFPQEQDGLWVCVCGRPNASDSHVCVRCHREREQVFTQFNREAIEKLTLQREQQLSLQAKAAREDASRLQLKREEEYRKKKKTRRRMAVMAASAVVVAAAAYGTVFHLMPYLRYRGAVSDMEAGRYEAAQTAFASMGDYAHAAENEAQCRYLLAVAELDSGDAEKLQAAEDTLRALTDIPEAAGQADEAAYRRAALYLTEGKTAEASALFTALGDYSDSATQVKQCAYVDAEKLLDAGEYVSAEVAFRMLGDYGDSADRMREAVYLPGKQALEASRWEDAISYLGEVADYRDAGELLRQAYYGKASALATAGDMEAAGDAYLLAGDYQDAAEQANVCLYAPAQAAYEAADYTKAAELFARIPGYQDATEKYQACAYALAQKAIKDTEYTRAGELLATLPDSYEDVLTLRQDCIYLPAVASLKRKDYAAAVEGFSRVSTYRDSADQLLTARYGLAEQLSGSGDYTGAVALYEQLGDYSDSVKLLRTARYNLGVAQLKAGEYEQAAALFTALDGYRDSEDKLQEAVYQQAVAAQTAEDYAGARALYATLGAYSDAELRIQACDYALAAKARDAGDRENAAAQFEALGDYQDAVTQAQALYYALATQAAQHGQTVLAGRYYAKAGTYENAAVLAAENYDAYYQEASVAAQDAMDNGEYPLVVTLLGSMDLTALPARYASLSTLYQEANYQEANRLYAAGKPYEALPYYRNIPDYKDVSAKLTRSCYLIVGTWVTDDGLTFLFRENGTCSLNGEELCFLVDNYAMNTGATPDKLTLTHKVSSIDDKKLTLRDTRNANVRTYRLTRVEEAVTAPPADTAAPTAAPDGVLPTPAPDEGSFAVVDDEE